MTVAAFLANEVCATGPLREKSGTPVALATQAISESRVNVMDPCATFFGNLARGSVASGAAVTSWSASVLGAHIGGRKVWGTDTEVCLPALEDRIQDCRPALPGKFGHQGGGRCNVILYQGLLRGGWWPTLFRVLAHEQKGASGQCFDGLQRILSGIIRIGGYGNVCRDD
jgi:hypothetical protein